MKRSWIGFILLIVLLLGCLLVTKVMAYIHEGVESRLLQTARMALDGNWYQAEDLFQRARRDWEKNSRFRSCFADHTPVEEIDAAFAMLEVTCAARDPVTFAGGCRSLACQVAAVGEAHELVWWNLF